jgi:hypothetical protein
MTLLLPTLDGSIRVEANADGWATVRLVAGGAETLLGAQTLRYIATRFKAFLSAQGGGKRWILSLSEVHVSMYGSGDGRSSTIWLEDSEGRAFAQLRVLPEQRDAWVERLDAACLT